MTREALTHVPAHPLRGTRELNAGEHAYHDEWMLVVNTPLDPDDDHEAEDLRVGTLGQILSNFPVYLTDRHSRLATAFMVWLGTNCGGSLVWDLKRKDRTFTELWATDQRRLRFVNGGFRTSDYLTSADWANPVLCKDAMELELFDGLAAWLDGKPGRAFLNRAEGRALAYRNKMSPADLTKVLELFKEVP